MRIRTDVGGSRKSHEANRNAAWLNGLNRRTRASQDGEETGQKRKVFHSLVRPNHIKLSGERRLGRRSSYRLHTPPQSLQATPPRLIASLREISTQLFVHLRAAEQEGQWILSVFTLNVTTSLLVAGLFSVAASFRPSGAELTSRTATKNVDARRRRIDFIIPSTSAN